MADKTLNDVVNALNSVKETIKNPPKSAADVEAATEAERASTEEKGIFQGIYDTLQKGFGSATTADKKQGGLIAGLLGGIGAGLGGIGKAVGNIGMGFGKGLAALGAGIAGFVLAIGGASMILDLMGTDGSALTGIITNFFNAFSEENAAKMGVLLVMAGLLAGFKVKPLVFAGMMTAMGAGIAGFAGGILIGSKIATYALTEMAGLDGSALAKLLNSFFGAMTAETAAGVGVLVTLAATAGKLDVGGIRMATIMTGIGAGIAGFAGGILIGSALSKFGLKALGALDTTSLTTLLNGFFSAITPEIAAGMGVIVTLAAVAAKLDISGLQMAAGMTGIGAGIAGFSLGILLADGAAKLGEMAKLDGSSLKTLLGNFMGAFDGIGISALAGLIIAGAAVGLVPGGVVAVVLGMTAIGAGIAGFMVPLLAADWIAGLGGDNAGGNLATLLTNIGRGIGGFLGGFAGETMKQMESIDGDKLAQIGKGIFDLGTGMLAFAGGRAAGGIADLAGGIGNAIGSLFGSEKTGPLHVFAEISKDTSIDANRLSELGTGISNLAIGLGTFADVSSTGLSANAMSAGLIANLPDAAGTFSKLKGAATGMMVQDKKMEQPDDDDDGSIYAEGMTKAQLKEKYDIKGKVTRSKIRSAKKRMRLQGREPGTYVNGVLVEKEAATGGLITPKTAGIFQLHQGEMVLDNAAVAAFTKSLNLVNMSQENAMAGMGGGAPVIINNNNVDNSMQSSQTTAVSIPAPTRSNESTLRALQAA
jgi:hypothetical protein